MQTKIDEPTFWLQVVLSTQQNWMDTLDKSLADRVCGTSYFISARGRSVLWTRIAMHVVWRVDLASTDDSNNVRLSTKVPPSFTSFPSGSR
jgi:hypothetical protein